MQAALADRSSPYNLGRHVRRCFKLGIPLILLGVAAGFAALQMGFDFTGDLLLAMGVLLALGGLALTAIGVFALAVMVERWIRGLIPRRRRTPPATAAAPAAGAADVAVASRAAGESHSNGPMIF